MYRTPEQTERLSAINSIFTSADDGREVRRLLHVAVASAMAVETISRRDELVARLILAAEENMPEVVDEHPLVKYFLDVAPDTITMENLLTDLLSVVHGADRNSAAFTKMVRGFMMIEIRELAKHHMDPETRKAVADVAAA